MSFTVLLLQLNSFFENKKKKLIILKSKQELTNSAIEHSFWSYPEYTQLRKAALERRYQNFFLTWENDNQERKWYRYLKNHKEISFWQNGCKTFKTMLKWENWSLEWTKFWRRKKNNELISAVDQTPRCKTWNILRLFKRTTRRLGRGLSSRHIFERTGMHSVQFWTDDLFVLI